MTIDFIHAYVSLIVATIIAFKLIPAALFIMIGVIAGYCFFEDD